MRHYEAHRRISLYFSRWSRKGYAVFSSLGRQIKIARLALRMYATVLLKSAGKGVIINTDHVLQVFFTVLKREMLEAVCGKTRRIVYPGVNDFWINGKGYVA
ncbi:MAG: hypothetical protein K2M86_02765 [Odoribacter sp.]|nr:hypothetical protein [Odoribacter sp.]